MSRKQIHNLEELTVDDAIETLSTIANLEIKEKAAKKLSQRKIKWLQDDEAVNFAIRETFRTLYNYVEHDKDCSQEKVHTIFKLVGETTHKLTSYEDLFNLYYPHLNLSKMQEFQKLQHLVHFPAQSVNPAINKWILNFNPHSKKHVKTKLIKSQDMSHHDIINLEKIKNDNQYELFYLRKDDGLRFINLRLLRNIQLICELNSSHYHSAKDPIYKIKQWYNKFIQKTASSIVEKVKHSLNQFFKEAMHHKGKFIVEDLNKASLALFLSSSMLHLNPNSSKQCSDYFHDFQTFFHELLHSNDYKKILSTSDGELSKLNQSIKNAVNSICTALFESTDGYSALNSTVWEFLLKTVRESHLKPKSLSNIYQSLSTALQHHSAGPLEKLLESLSKNEGDHFNPILQGNLPSSLFEISYDDHSTKHIRMPCPVSQEYIQRAYLDEEFIHYLKNNADRSLKHLYINLQDRTNWLESARCTAIESLSHQKDISDHFSVATLDTNTDFYYQKGNYEKLIDAEQFKSIFVDQMLDSTAGYYFSADIKNKLTTDYLHAFLDTIHSQFFANEVSLTQDKRKVFIDITHVLFSLKLIEITRANIFNFSCKDGVDIAPTLTTLLFYLLRQLGTCDNQTAAKYESILPFIPALLFRERLVNTQRFERLLACINYLEEEKKQWQPLSAQLKSLFSVPFWESTTDYEFDN